MGSGLAPWACCSLIGNESSTRQLGVRSEELGVRSGGAAPDPSTQFSLFRLYMIEHPTFHSAQDDEMRRGVLIVLRAHRHFEHSRGSLLQNVHRLM